MATRLHHAHADSAAAAKPLPLPLPPPPVPPPAPGTTDESSRGKINNPNNPNNNSNNNNNNGSAPSVSSLSSAVSSSSSSTIDGGGGSVGPHQRDLICLCTKAPKVPRPRNGESGTFRVSFFSSFFFFFLFFLYRKGPTLPVARPIPKSGGGLLVWARGHCQPNPQYHGPSDTNMGMKVSILRGATRPCTRPPFVLSTFVLPEGTKGDRRVM
ncbi:hypothetical protein GGR56DRAFT_27256 [Xylariaceae sp. FL0804]|nr:hypothetical protein GGR56DRAFT_27256 [Xylariaceae sp. FL0804]